MLYPLSYEGLLTSDRLPDSCHTGWWGLRTSAELPGPILRSVTMRYSLW